jgi:Fic family protein
MKIPQSPPPFHEAFHRLSKARQAEVLFHPGGANSDKRYLHWNDLRRKPPPAGLSAEEWWLNIKWWRMRDYRRIGLKDKQGQPFVFGTPDSLQQSLHEIDRGLGFALNLPESVVQPDVRDSYIVSALVQESITSSQLEGAVTTREVAKEMLRSGRQPRDKSERMILNNYLTMQRIQSLRTEPLSPELVFELHRRVTEGTLEKPDAAGRFRRTEENIRVIDEIEGTEFHIPPPAKELSDRLQAMCDFANGQAPDYFVHPVLRAIILHFWLAYDHPFVDGNGRTARALFYWSMLRQGYTLFEFVSISQILLLAPVRYAEAFLHTETDENDLTYFILHQTEVITRAVEALHQYAAKKASDLKKTDRLLRGLEGLNHRQQALLTHAMRNPSARYLIEGHRRSHAVTFPTARNDLFNLVERGLLTVNKEGRFNVFRPVLDLSDKLGRMGETAPKAADTGTLPLRLPFRTVQD